MDKQARIYIAGHTGMVGSAIMRLLVARGYRNLVVVKRADLDLRQPREVEAWFRNVRPDYVFMAAARVGGIQANIAQPAEFVRDNLAMQTAVIHAAHTSRVSKLLFLGSSCMYPRDCPQPMREDMLLSGPPEPTNRAYAIAKLAGMEMCRAYAQQYGSRFFTAIPCNVYGPGDHYEPELAHVIPALIAKMVKAARANEWHVDVWGDGQARREFMHVDDLAAACLFLMEKYESTEPVNVGAGVDYTIFELASYLREEIKFYGALNMEHNKPSGAPRKLLDSSRLNALGWQPRIGLEEGLRRTVREYMERG